MKIKEQNSQRMIFGPTMGERISWVPFFPFIILVGFYSYVGPVISIVWGLFIVGKIIGTTVIIDKLNEIITVEKRHFLLIHKQRVIPFSAVTDIRTGYGAYDWKVYICTDDRKVGVGLTTKKKDLHDLASVVSSFLGRELVDNSP